MPGAESKEMLVQVRRCSSRGWASGNPAAAALLPLQQLSPCSSGSALLQQRCAPCSSGAPPAAAPPGSAEPPL